MLKAFPVSSGTVENLIFYNLIVLPQEEMSILGQLGTFPLWKIQKINGQYSKVGLPTGVSYEEIHCLLKERV